MRRLLLKHQRPPIYSPPLRQPTTMPGPPSPVAQTTCPPPNILPLQRLAPHPSLHPICLKPSPATGRNPMRPPAAAHLPMTANANAAAARAKASLPRLTPSPVPPSQARRTRMPPTRYLSLHPSPPQLHPPLLPLHSKHASRYPGLNSIRKPSPAKLGKFSSPRSVRKASP